MANDVAQNGFIARIRERPSVHDGAAAGRLISEFGGEFSARFAALPEPAQSLVRAIGGASPYLSRLIERGPAALFAILDQSPEESLKRLIARADAAGDLESVEAVMRELRKAKAEAALFFALVEIAGVWSSLEAAAGLSDFTDA
ncbi:MAG TPA: hypothetical protein PLV61_18245, partial [Parvularculaceae bacterium]|nr:hypothetical protein [Parvularculaceae bacterium]